MRVTTKQIAELSKAETAEAVKDYVQKHHGFRPKEVQFTIGNEYYDAFSGDGFPVLRGCKAE